MDAYEYMEGKYGAKWREDQYFEGEEAPIRPRHFSRSVFRPEKHGQKAVTVEEALENLGLTRGESREESNE